MVDIKLDINYLLNTYEKLVSQNTSRISESLDRVTRALHCQVIDRFPVLQTSQSVVYPRHEVFSSPEKNLIMQLINILLTLEHRTDYVPFLDPFEGVTILAEAFGCKTEILLNSDPIVRNPIINNPWEVYDLKKPAKNNDVYKRVLRTLRFFEKKTGYSIPVGSTDPQSPLNVASLIWDNSSFLMSCITNPKEVHFLLNMVTDAFIEFYSMQYDKLKNPAFPVHSFPLVGSNDGISISDDEVVLFSPELYEEFGVPYLNRISEAFGGMYYHSCGNFNSLIDSILKIKRLRAVNAHLSPNEFKPSNIKKFLGKGIGIFLGISDREIGWNSEDVWKQEDIFKFYDQSYIHDVISMSEGTGIALVGYGSYSGYLNLSKIDYSANMLINSSGHIIEKGPLINVPIEEKNKNFEHIINLLKKI